MGICTMFIEDTKIRITRRDYEVGHRNLDNIQISYAQLTGRFLEVTFPQMLH